MRKTIHKNTRTGIVFSLSKQEYKALPDYVKQLFPENRFSFSYLLTTNSVKTTKGEKKGYITGVMYLAPHSISGVNFCPMSTKECRITCLWSSGQLGLINGRMATVARSVFLNHFPKEFISRLFLEVGKLEKRASKKDMSLAIRLNGTSDLAWESSKYSKVLVELMESFPNAQFYDYTKIPLRTTANYRQKNNLGNYHLTLSYSGQNWNHCQNALQSGCNVAAVFADVPSEYQGYKVILGDDDDLRFKDESGVIVGLKYKRAKKVNDKGTFNILDFPEFVIQ